MEADADEEITASHLMKLLYGNVALWFVANVTFFLVIWFKVRSQERAKQHQLQRDALSLQLPSSATDRRASTLF